jgi:hypothetical protein
MLGCDINFMESKDFALTIVAKRDAITWTLILPKECEHPSLPDHKISAPTIYHPTCSTG